MSGPVLMNGMRSVAGLVGVMLLSTLSGCQGRNTPRPTATGSAEHVQTEQVRIDLGAENPPDTKRSRASGASAQPQAPESSHPSPQEDLRKEQSAREAAKKPSPATPPEKTRDKGRAEAPSRSTSRIPSNEERFPEYTAKALTPADQSEAKGDLELTRRIRRALVEDEQLSMAGKNIQIVTTNGPVVLQGRVPTEQEWQRILHRAQGVAGSRLESRLEVVGSR